MTHEVIFEIARYAVDTGEEVLVEKAQLIRDGAVLSSRFANQMARLCKTGDPTEMIGGMPALRDVHPNQVTRIQAIAEIEQELPLVLTPTGNWNDFDDSRWSPAMTCEYAEPEVLSVLPHDPYRVLFVNDQPWRMWKIGDGLSMLPANGAEPNFYTEWATATVFESGTMRSGQTNGVIGPLTPSIVAEIYTPDGSDLIDDDDPGSSLALTRWDGTAEAAAHLLASWITTGPAQFYFYCEGTYTDPKFFVQLFIEGAMRNEPQVSCTAEELIEASGYEVGYFSRGSDGPPSSDFGLTLNTGRDVIEAALTTIAKEGDAYADMITAARDPESAEAQARDKRWTAIQGEFWD